LYWQQGDYRGVGCAAHSHASGRRWWNVRTPERYIAAIDEGRSPVAVEETLSPDERRLERLQLRLRTRDGVPLDALGADVVDDLGRLVDATAGDGAVRLTAEGRLLANEVAVRLRSA
jgi:oxygen-independent coproporphyrinogen-3 oxidase